MGGPDLPDANLAAISGSRADLRNYPFVQQINALAKLGGTQTINGKQYNFSGLGDADTASAVSDQMAQAMLDIQKNNGADFIKQRLADLKQSDPIGYAARQQLFDKILADADTNPSRPLADDAQKQIMELLQENGQLTGGSGGELEQVQQGVRGRQLHNGIYLGNAPASEEASTVVNASDAKRTANQQQALGFQLSGVSPEDVEYRRIQQSLSNLGAAINGQNPTAQFASLSGAGNGAAPFTTTGSPYTPTNGNAALNGVQNANSIYAGNVNWANSQVNPFVAGMSGLANVAQGASALGYNFGGTNPGGYNAGYNNFSSPQFSPITTPTYNTGGQGMFGQPHE